jgi:hypothetical protein
MMDADVVCPTPARPMVFQAYVRAVNEPTERLQRLEQALQEQVNAWRVHPVVEALQALRGVPCTVAVTTVAELGDLTRVDPPRQRMQSLGLISVVFQPCCFPQIALVVSRVCRINRHNATLRGHGDRRG